MCSKHLLESIWSWKRVTFTFCACKVNTSTCIINYIVCSWPYIVYTWSVNSIWARFFICHLYKDSRYMVYRLYIYIMVSEFHMGLELRSRPIWNYMTHINHKRSTTNHVANNTIHISNQNLKKLICFNLHVHVPYLYPLG